jgi:hypothetical protein
MGGKEISTMAAGFKNKNDLVLNKVVENTSIKGEIAESLPDPQVKAKIMVSSTIIDHAL